MTQLTNILQEIRIRGSIKSYRAVYNSELKDKDKFNMGFIFGPWANLNHINEVINDGEELDRNNDLILLRKFMKDNGIDIIIFDDY